MKSYEGQLRNLAKRHGINLQDVCYRYAGRATYYRVFKNGTTRLRYATAWMLYNAMRKMMEGRRAKKK